MFKKPSIFLSWQNFHPATSKTSSLSSLPPSWGHPPAQHRRYAMVSGGHSKHEHNSLRWPEVNSANSIPTPYQIFNQRKGAPYSKKRFYELVKLYHPDRHDFDPSDDCLPYGTKLERYRLVVAANDILSDPVKRSAYDYYGAGWNGSPDVLRPQDAADPSNVWGGRGWGGGPGGPSQNATWEDWERWYQKDAKGPQEPTFVSNSAFVGLIFAFAVIGGVGQATRASSYGKEFIEQRDHLHGNISKDLVRRRREAMHAYGSREERIESFLKQRDPVGHGLAEGPKTEEYYRKLLLVPEVGLNQEIKTRSMDIYHEKNNPKNG